MREWALHRAVVVVDIVLVDIGAALGTVLVDIGVVVGTALADIEAVGGTGRWLLPVSMRKLSV